MLYERILVTGANGLLGTELVGLLGRFSEYDVLATGRGETSRSAGSHGYMPLDITARRDVQHAVRDFQPTVVINCAAMTDVDRCETNREACWKVNVDAVETLAQQCKDTGARLIQLSTDFVFDGLDGPYREDARPNPVNFYGKSKQAAENAVRKAGFDKWAIVRHSACLRRRIACEPLRFRTLAAGATVFGTIRPDRYGPMAEPYLRDRPCRGRRTPRATAARRHFPSFRSGMDVHVRFCPHDRRGVRPGRYADSASRQRCVSTSRRATGQNRIDYSESPDGTWLPPQAPPGAPAQGRSSVSATFDPIVRIFCPPIASFAT